MEGTLTNTETGQEHHLETVNILGRSPECNVLIADPRVSRRHAMIRLQEGGFWFYDLGSFNGSYLNGNRVTTTRQLNDNDVIELAGLKFEFRQAGDGFSEMDTEALGASTIALIRSTPLIILVSDIEGFTTLSEKLPPDEVAQTIGTWYGDCDRILTSHGATVDKFSGDSVLAYWTDVTTGNRLQALRSVAGLLEACHQSYLRRKELFDSMGLTFGSGAAIHIGKVAYGGMSQREFTLLGDPVNLTFRIEGLTRKLGYHALVTADFIRDWPEAREYCEPLGMHTVKGRSQPVEIYGVTKYPS